MSRRLLIAGLVGFAFAAWGFLTSAEIRPTPFNLMEQTIDEAAVTDKMTPEQKELLTLRVAELRGAHEAEVSRYARSYFITFAGLVGVSALALVAYASSRRKAAQPAPQRSGCG